MPRVSIRKLRRASIPPVLVTFRNISGFPLCIAYRRRLQGPAVVATVQPNETIAEGDPLGISYLRQCRELEEVM